MIVRCDSRVDKIEIVKYDQHTVPQGMSVSCRCLRPAGHSGAHMVKRVDGPYIAWIEAPCLPGECTSCDSVDTAEACFVYNEITSAAERQRYLHEPTYKGMLV
jgi:hypothetical protein